MELSRRCGGVGRATSEAAEPSSCAQPSEEWYCWAVHEILSCHFTTSVNKTVPKMQASMLQQRHVRPFQASPVGRRSCVVVSAKSPKFSAANVLQAIMSDNLKKDPPTVSVGDSVRVGLSVVEGKGKTRTQTLEGVIIGQKGSGTGKTIKFRRIFQVGGDMLLDKDHGVSSRYTEL